MSNDSKSRVKNKKQFDKTLDEIRKKRKKSIAKKIKEVRKTDYGRATRYYY